MKFYFFFIDFAYILAWLTPFVGFENVSFAHDWKRCSRSGKFLRSMLSKEVTTPETHTQPDNLETNLPVFLSSFGHYANTKTGQTKKLKSFHRRLHIIREIISCLNFVFEDVNTKKTTKGPL